jgi:fluoroacetyl-CoA thioesterase
VIGMEGRQIVFKVSARDETEEIGNGTHHRTMIDLASFNQRVAKKSKR